MRALILAALLVAGAAPLTAQITIPRSDAWRPDTVVRPGVVRRGEVGGSPNQTAWLAGGLPVPQRSAIGVWLGRADADGLRVERVSADGPAARAGIVAGDRLVAINNVALRVDRAESDDPILSAVPARRVERAVGQLAPGSEIELRVAHAGQERAVRVRTVAPDAVAERGSVTRAYRLRPGAVELFGPSSAGFRAPIDDSASADLRRRARTLADSARTRAVARPVLGITLQPSTGARDTLGLFVSAIVTGGPAERAGVVEGDRLATVDGVDLRVPRDERDDARAVDARRARFTRALERRRPGDRVTLRVYGDGRWRTVTATMARADSVYRGEMGVGAGAVGPEWLFPGGAPGTPMFRELRVAPMPNVLFPPPPAEGEAAGQRPWLLRPRFTVPRPPVPPRVIRRTVVL